MSPSDVPYNPTEITPEAGVPDASIRSESTSQDFGSQSAAATEKMGDTVEDIGAKYLQMATEAKAENAIANQFVPAAAQLKADYMKNKGMDALKAQPEYLASVQNLRNQFISNSNSPYEAHILSSYMVRHAAQETDFSAMYAEQQQNEYEAQSHKAMLDTYSNNSAQNYKNPGVIEQNIKASDGLTLKRGLDLGQDTETTIPYQQSVNRGTIVKNTIDAAIAGGDVPAAVSIFNTYKGTMSAADTRQIEAAMAPKVSDHDSRALSEYVLGQHNLQYHQQAYGSGGGVDPYNLGNVKTSQGAANGTADFVHPASAVDGVVLAANNLRSGYQGMTLAQIGPKWTGEPDKAADWVKNASAASGLGPDISLNLNDPATLAKLMKGIASAEKSPAQQANFTDDVISQGVQKSLAGDKAATVAGQAIPSNGKLIPSIGDYYKANYNSILDNARSEAAIMRPNDIDFIEKTEARVKQQLDTRIEGENKANQANLDILTKAVNGDFTKDTQPTTIDELTNINPQVSAAWSQLQQNDPRSAQTIATRVIGSKSQGKMGSGFSYLQQEAYAGRVSVNDLLYHVGDDLTQEGFKALHEITAVKSKDSLSPSDRSDNESMATFLKYGHDRILHSSLFKNTPEAEQQYQAWFSSVTKQIKDAQSGDSKIPLASLLDKNSKDYVGGNIDQFLMPVTKQLSDRAARINGVRATVGNAQPRLPGETPEEYFARVK